jgi:hypothetical protein
MERKTQLYAMSIQRQAQEEETAISESTARKAARRRSSQKCLREILSPVEKITLRLIEMSIVHSYEALFPCLSSLVADCVLNHEPADADLYARDLNELHPIYLSHLDDARDACVDVPDLGGINEVNVHGTEEQDQNIVVLMECFEDGFRDVVQCTIADYKMRLGEIGDGWNAEMKDIRRKFDRKVAKFKRGRHAWEVKLYDDLDDEADSNSIVQREYEDRVRERLSQGDFEGARKQTFEMEQAKAEILTKRVAAVHARYDRLRQRKEDEHEREVEAVENLLGEKLSELESGLRNDANELKERVAASLNLSRHRFIGYAARVDIIDAGPRRQLARNFVRIQEAICKSHDLVDVFRIN